MDVRASRKLEETDMEEGGQEPEMKKTPDFSGVSHDSQPNCSARATGLEPATSRSTVRVIRTLQPYFPSKNRRPTPKGVPPGVPNEKAKGASPTPNWPQSWPRGRRFRSQSRPASWQWCGSRARESRSERLRCQRNGRNPMPTYYWQKAGPCEGHGVDALRTDRGTVGDPGPAGRSQGEAGVQSAASATPRTAADLSGLLLEERWPGLPPTPPDAVPAKPCRGGSVPRRSGLFAGTWTAIISLSD